MSEPESKSERKFLGLRYGITGLAFTFALVHVIWPDLNIDLVTLGLFIVALLPWLQPIVRSIEITGLGKVELQEFESRLANVEGATKSTERKVELATAERKTAALTPEEAATQFSDLAAEYNHIRANHKPGDARTALMTSVVRRLIDVAPMLADYDLDSALISEDRGQRLGGYAYLYALPDFNYVTPLTECLTQREDKPFGQFWAILALTKLLGKREDLTIPETVIQDFRTYADKLSSGSDRRYEAKKILREFNYIEIDD